MAQAAPKIEFHTPEEHQRIEEETGIRHEWYDGEIFAMAGGTPAHNTIGVNVSSSLHQQLRGRPCQPWGSDQQVKIVARNVVTYPDISVACPPFEYDERHRNALVNPSVIIEVLSPSTEQYDRVGKFDLYKLIPTLTDYVLIASDQRRIEHFSKQSQNLWTHSVAREGNDCITLASIQCSLCLNDVYERLQLPENLEHPILTPDI